MYTFLGVFFLLIAVIQISIGIFVGYDFNKRIFSSNSEKIFWRKKIFGLGKIFGKYKYLFSVILKSKS